MASSWTPAPADRASAHLRSTPAVVGRGVNAQLGSAELGNDIASWRGSYILAFVAYNAGPRRAKEWIDQYGDPRDEKVDPVDWIERIPLSETRNYVQRIMENIQVYRARLDNSPRLMIEADLRRGG